MKLEFQETEVQPSDMPFILNVKTRNYVAKLNKNTSECVDAIYNHLIQEDFSLIINKEYLFLWGENDDSFEFSEIASVGEKKLCEVRIVKGNDKKKIVELWYKLGSLNIFSIIIVGPISTPHDFAFMKQGWWIFGEWVPVFETNASFDIYYLYYDANSLIKITNK